MFIIRDSSPESFSSHAWNSLIYYPSFRTFKRSIIAIIQGSFYFILSLFKNSYRYIIPRLCSNSLKYSQSPFSRKKFFYLFTFLFYSSSLFFSFQINLSYFPRAIHNCLRVLLNVLHFDVN